MFTLLHAVSANPGPNVISNPEAVNEGNVLFKMTLNGEYADLLPYLEEQAPGQITYGPNAEYSLTGYASPDLGPPLGDRGSIAFSDINPGIFNLEAVMFYLARVRDLSVGGTPFPDSIILQWQFKIQRADADLKIKINRMEIEGGYTLDLSADPQSPDNSTHEWAGQDTLPLDWTATYIPLPVTVVTVYGEFVENTDPIPDVPGGAVPGTIMPGFGLVTHRSNYIHYLQQRAWAYKMHPSQLQTQFSLIHETEGSFAGVLTGQFLLKLDGTLMFENDTLQIIPIQIATNCKSICPAFSGIRYGDLLGDYDEIPSVFIVKNDNKLSWWSLDNDPHGTGINNIPASLAAGSETIQCVRHSGMGMLWAPPERPSRGALFGALTTAGDLYIWGRQAVELGFPTTPINVPGAVDFVITLEEPIPNVRVLTDTGHLFIVGPDGSITANGGYIKRMNKPIYETTRLETIGGDGRFLINGMDTGDTSGSDIAFLSQKPVVYGGNIREYYGNGTELDPFTSEDFWAEPKAPPGLTIFYPGKVVYDTTTSPVPAKYRRCGGLGVGPGAGPAYFDREGRLRRFYYGAGGETSVYCEYLGGDSGVDFEKLNGRNSAVLDVFGDVYDNGSPTLQQRQRQYLFGVKVKAIFSGYLPGGFPDVGLFGLGLDDKLVLPTESDWTIPAHAVGKVMRYMGKMSAISSGYVSITVDGDIFYSGWGWNDGIPEHTGSDAVEFHPISYPIIDATTGVVVDENDSAYESALVRNPDGTISELPRALGTMAWRGKVTNAVQGLNVSDVKKLDTKLRSLIVVQLSSDPKKLRVRGHAYFWGGPSDPGNFKRKLTQWFDITLPAVPVDWWAAEVGSGSSTGYSWTLMYVRQDIGGGYVGGSLWVYKVTWASIDNPSAFTVLHEAVIPGGEVRQDIKTIGAPPVTGGWGLNWGNSFGGV